MNISTLDGAAVSAARNKKNQINSSSSLNNPVYFENNMNYNHGK
jgi:hypothetical protein